MEEVDKIRELESQLAGAHDMHLALKAQWRDEMDAELERRTGALQAELDKARGALELGDEIDAFDCPHDAEQWCKCGDVQREMLARYRQLRDALTPAPPSNAGEEAGS